MGKALVRVGAIFTPIGLLFAGIGGWFFWDDQQLADIGVHGKGTVIEMVSSRDSDGDRTYKPRVEFVDGTGTRHQFTSRVSSNPPSHSRGDTVEIIYDPDAPGNAMIDGFVDRFLLPLVFGGMGSLFAAVGTGMLFTHWRRRRIIAQLLRSGIPMQAKFLECYRDTRTKVNGRSPYRVVAQATHPGTGKLQSFKSDPIWLNLSEQLAGQTIRVLIDPAKPKWHYVDLSKFVDANEKA